MRSGGEEGRGRAGVKGTREKEEREGGEERGVRDGRSTSGGTNKQTNMGSAMKQDDNNHKTVHVGPLHIHDDNNPLTGTNEARFNGVLMRRPAL